MMGHICPHGRRCATCAERESPPEPICTEFLVHGECECGWYCACPEGWTWPNCPDCGGPVRPKRDAPYEPTGKMQGHGYVAQLHPEQDAVKIARQRGRWFVDTRTKSMLTEVS